MPAILTGATDAQLAVAVEENLFDLFRAVATLPGGEIVEGARLNHHSTMYAAAMFNAVWNARLEAGEVDAAIEQMQGWFKARNAPLAAWWFGSSTNPTIRER